LGPSNTSDAIERVARDAYGKVVAIVARSTGDLHAAEDAVSDALAAALRSWPRDGVPERPEAWIVAAARRRWIDVARRDARRREPGDLEAMVAAGSAEPTFPDERLGLLFACAHPAIDAAVRTPLMLRVVLGLEVERIASTLLVSPAALKQRLTRAKAKVRDAGIRLELPEPEQLPARLDAVLGAIYAALTAGVGDATPGKGPPGGLAAEAVHLARVLCELTPDTPEALGLLALGLYCQSRSAAQTSLEGRFVPLDEQNPRDWDAALVSEAEQTLRRAVAFGRLGRYQIEASIQSAHVDRLRGGGATWAQVASLYFLLLRFAPSVGAEVGLAGALLASSDATGALDALDALTARDGERLAGFQPFWAVRGETLARLGRHAEAKHAFNRAIGLTSDPRVRAYLSSKLT
jgi:RNA polymerase sigma-70 factor (ECF subfamily)